MAESTGYVLAAGGLVFVDRLVTEKKLDLIVAVATGAACLATAGLDRVIPGFGKGVGVLLVLGAVLTVGPRVVGAVVPSKTKPKPK